MEQVESLMIGSTFRRINVGQIHAFWICVPPLPEQAAIAAYLDKETAKLDALVRKVEEAVERLQDTAPPSSPPRSPARSMRDLAAERAKKVDA